MENGKSQEFVNKLVREIPGTDGKYAVNATGAILRFKAGKWNYLKGEINHGYHRVNLSFGKVAKKFRVHRLVAQAFIENPLNKPFVNHKDGNKLNNCVENLEWCTSSENEYHSYRVLGKSVPWTKPDHVREEAINMRISGIPSRVICESLGVSRAWMDKLVASHAI